MNICLFTLAFFANKNLTYNICRNNYDEYKKDVFKIWSNLLKISYYDITEKYMTSFMVTWNLKWFYAINNPSQIKSIQSELERVFYKAYHIYHENRMSQRETFIKSNRDVLITQGSFLLLYLRQGLIQLSQLNWIVFEPEKLKIGEENWIETIIKEFYIPMLEFGTVSLPKIYIVDGWKDRVRIVWRSF